MKSASRLCEMWMAVSCAHAAWDYEISMSIFRDRRKMVLLISLLIPVLLASAAAATGYLPEVLGGKKAYSPAHYTPFVFGVSILIGFSAGLITGCVGAGGGFIIIPALMSAGIKGILAVGTDLFHIFAKAIIGTAVHKEPGNVSPQLAIAFVVGSVIGVTLGGSINRTLYDINPILSDTFISLAYVVLLGFLGFYALGDFLRMRTRGPYPRPYPGVSLETLDLTTPGKALSERFQSSNIPPLIHFDRHLVPGGKTIPAVFVSSCGALVGLVVSIMGVGGGFLTFPIFVHLLGVSSFTTIGTDILQIVFTAGFAAISQYAAFGFILYTLAMGMLLGSLVGVQLGAMTTRVAKGIHLRAFYASAILAAFANRLFALPSKLDDLEVTTLPQVLSDALSIVGNIGFFLVVGIFALWVVSTFFLNINRLRQEV